MHAGADGWSMHLLVDVSARGRLEARMDDDDGGGG